MAEQKPKPIPICNTCHRNPVVVHKNGNVYTKCQPCINKKKEATRQRNLAVKRAKPKADRETKQAEVILKQQREIAELKARLGSTSSVSPGAEVAETPKQEVDVEFLDDAPQEAAPTTPWTPASVLTVSGQDPNFVYRWCRDDLLDKKLAEGWEFVKTDGSERAGQGLVIDPAVAKDGPVEGSIVKREMVLCRLPKHIAAARAEYYRKLTVDAVGASVDRFREDAQVGGEDNVYGELKVKIGSKVA